MASLDSSEAFLLDGHYAARPLDEMRDRHPTPFIRALASPAMR